MNGSLAFTWSPNPNIYKGYFKPVMQHNNCLPVIRLLHKCAQGVVYPELNQNGNIHYHAKLNILDNIKWYKQVLPTFKRHGYVVIKRGNINEKWDEYIKKDQVLIQEILEQPIPIIVRPTPLTKGGRGVVA